MTKQQYPVTFSDAQSFTIFINRLELRNKRLQQSKDYTPDNRPLDEREQKALAAIDKQVDLQLKILSNETRDIAQAAINNAKIILGTRGYLETFLAEPLIMGVPYVWFVANAFLCLVIFIFTNSFMAVCFVGPVIHGIEFLVFRPQREEQREASIKKLLGETSVII